MSAFENLELPEETRRKLEANERRGRKQPPQPDPATIEEQRAILDEHEKVAHGHHVRRIHPVDDETGRPLCYDFQGNSDTSEWSRRPASAYPPGHREICRICIGNWRQERAGGVSNCEGCGQFTRTTYRRCPGCRDDG